MFSEEIFTVAGVHLSLDIIEHGILRGNKWKYGFGYVHGGHLPSKIRYWKCKKIDYRIHFLLNCGAASCPVIRVLSESNLDSELNAAEKYFVQTEITKNEIKILSFYRACSCIIWETLGDSRGCAEG